MTVKHILVLGQYPIDSLDRAPKVRTYRMAEALARHATVTLITGTRRQRRPVLQEAWKRGLLKQVDAVYVESASSTATWADLRFLWRVKRAGLPLAIFVRDYYQKFPDLYPIKGPGGHALKVLYGVTLRAYAGCADILYVPTMGLGELLPRREVRLLPPGAHCISRPDAVGRGQNPWILYVGAGGAYDGVALLIDAMRIVHQTLPNARLALVMRRQEWPQGTLPAYIQLTEASGPDLVPWYQRADVAVIPRPDTAYTRLAWPLKLMDYLSYGIPVVVTDQSEAAQFVERYQIGLRTPYDAQALARGLTQLLDSEPARRQCQVNAAAAVQTGHSWDHRALTLLEDLAGKM